MARKKLRLNIIRKHSAVIEAPDNTSAFVKNSYRLILCSLFLYALISLFLGPRNFESEVITNVDYKMYHSSGGRYGGGGSSSTDITLSTDFGNEYFISIPPGGRPFKGGDTVLVFSNLFNKTVGIEKGQFYYNLGKLKGLLILLTITSLLGFLYTLFGDFRTKFVLYIIAILNSGLLLLYLT